MTIKQPIESSRYTVHEISGRGCWGTVYQATDNLTKRTVAIKVLEPTELAQVQMQHRRLNEQDILLKEALWPAPLRHVVPRTLEQDDNGKKFIVMPFYSKFLSDLFEEKEKLGPQKISRITDEGKTTMYTTPAGFMIDEIITIGKDIAEGLEEIHTTYRVAHCDIKPDNLALDEHGRVLFADMGTSTIASRYSEDPRDNMGFCYTRAPWLSAKEAHPTRDADTFAFGSLLCKMFTGKYALQEEIDACRPEEVCKSLNRIWRNASGEESHYAITRRKTENQNIPTEFRTFITDCLNGNIRDGKEGRQLFEQAAKKYEENRTLQAAIASFARSAGRKIGIAFVAGAALSAAVLSAQWVRFYSPPPDFSQRADLETMVEVRRIDNNDVILLTENEYRPVTISQTAGLSPFGKDVLEFAMQKGEKEKRNNVASAIAHEIVSTALAAQTDISYPDVHRRWRGLTIFTSPGSPQFNAAPGYFFDHIKTLTVNALGVHQTGTNTCDLEDAVVSVVHGNHRLQQAQKYANSGNFGQYINACRPDGKPFFTDHDKAYLRTTLHNISRALPGQVRLESDWKQSAPDGTTRADAKR